MDYPISARAVGRRPIRMRRSASRACRASSSATTARAAQPPRSRNARPPRLRECIEPSLAAPHPPAARVPPSPGLGERVGVRGLRVRLAIALLAPALLATPAWAQRFGAEAFTLDNGMQLVVMPNHRVPAVMQMVWYKVGGADDSVGKSGLAHFLEHLMFKGTAATPPGAFAASISRNGG